MDFTEYEEKKKKGKSELGLGLTIGRSPDNFSIPVGLHNVTPIHLSND